MVPNTSGITQTESDAFCQDIKTKLYDRNGDLTYECSDLSNCATADSEI